ncbi:hypothetical protein D3C78_1825320 [compost metagenome]
MALAICAAPMPWAASCLMRSQPRMTVTHAASTLSAWSVVSSRFTATRASPTRLRASASVSAKTSTSPPATSFETISTSMRPPSGQ